MSWQTPGYLIPEQDEVPTEPFPEEESPDAALPPAGDGLLLDSTDPGGGVRLPPNDGIVVARHLEELACRGIRSKEKDVPPASPGPS